MSDQNIQEQPESAARGCVQRVVIPPKFDESPEIIGEVTSLIGLALVCWFDWRLGIGLMLMFGRIYRFVVLATRRYNEEAHRSAATTEGTNEK